MKSYSDLSGDGGSNIAEQVVEQKRRIEGRLDGLRYVLAVGSGKGGVGKSTLTMMLAMALRKRGFAPAILDADINGPCQARLSGLKALTPVPGQSGLNVPISPNGIGIVSFGTLVPETQAVDFPSLSKGDSFVWRATKEFSVLSDFLADTDWSPFDLLLLDLPPGSERTVQYAEFLGGRAQFVLVTVPSDVSRGVVLRSVAALDKVKSPAVGYIENMKGYYCWDCDEVRPLFPSSEDIDLGIPCLGKVPFHPVLAEACDSGLTSKSPPPCTESVDVICDNLLEILESEE